MSSAHIPLARLLSANKQWADDVRKMEGSDFFAKAAEGQTPKVLWIGCADSRVSELVTGARPGEIFVHRNIANQFRLDDDSAQSVLTYAIDVLGCTHVIVVGHTQCGGAAACYKAAQAPKEAPSTALGRWLAPLTDVARSLQLSSKYKTEEEALKALSVENIKLQVANLCKTETLTKVWRNKEKKVFVHGWLYDIPNGILNDLNVSKGPGL